MKTVNSIIALIFCLLLAGCSFITSRLDIAKTEKDREIAALKANYEWQLSKESERIDLAVKKTIMAKDKQIESAAESLYGADFVFKTIMAPTRTDLVTNNLVNEAWSALGYVQPSHEAVLRVNERLKKELDEAKTSLNDLLKNHQNVLSQNQQLVDLTRKNQAELAAAEESKRKLRDEFQTKLAAKQGELIDLQKLIVEKEKEISDHKKARQAQIAKLSWGAGIIAALCVAGAIWSPVSKKELIIAAATFGGAAVALPFVEMWHVMVGLGVVVVFVFGYVLYKYRKEERVSDALILANEDIKEKEPDLWKNKVAPVVEDRLKTYKKKAGKLVPEKDPSIEKHIDAKLAEFDALGRSPLSAPPSPSPTK